MELSEEINIENKKLNERMDEEIDDTEEGEILEEGEIADEEDINDKKDDIKVEEKENNNKDKDNILKDRDSRRKEDSIRKNDENKSRDKERERNNRDRDRDKDRERRHDYQRSDRSDRDRKSADRKSGSNDDDRDKRRRDRDRKRRRSEEEEERDKRKRSRDQNNLEFNESFNPRNNFEDYESLRRFEDFDFRQTDPSFINTNAIHHESDDEDLAFDERDFEEVMQIMEHRMPGNRMMGSNDSLPANEKKAMMRAMALMMKRNIDTDKTRRLARLKDKRRARDRTPGPTGTRASTRQNERNERTPAFKPLCKFFIEGKCHKGSECSYSHETSPNKKKEICKFYLQGFCGKGEECLFMHNEFPCKFFHTNVECYSGDNCRFSHLPLNDDTRQILRNYLDSGQLPDDPKPDRNEIQTKSENNKIEENNINSSQTNNMNNSQINSNNNTSSSSTTYTPMKPVAKRHAILGDPTQEMKTSYYTWLWQQEMKELEVAYVGNKRNLFCIENKFSISEKPSTPRMEDDEEEIEAQIRSYYMETMGNLENEEIEVKKEVVMSEEQKLIEASAHDEDLRTLSMRPTNKANESKNSKSKEVKIEENLSEESQSISKPQTSEVPTNLPKVARDLYLKMQNKIQTESESKSSWLSDSDDDDKDVLAAALKNVQQKSSPKSSSPDKSKRAIDISKMLSAIRQSSNTTTANTSTKQSEFWQNILSGINLAGSSPSGNNTPPRNDYRDPRLKRGKDSLSPTIDTTPPVKICDPNVIIEYKLLPLTITDIDYSCYVSIYRIDSRLKNDPRLQKFFAKLPTSEIDNLSRIVPPPLKTAPVTPLSVLKSKKKSEKEKREKKAKSSSPTLPPLPPLTISPSKSIPTPGIIPPTPPPIMSPLELISSRPTFTVGDNKSPNNNHNKELISNILMKEEIKVEAEVVKSPQQSASSPEPSIQSEDNEKEEKFNPKSLSPILPQCLNKIVVTTAANSLSLNTIDINDNPLLFSSPPPLSTSLSLTLTSELYDSSLTSSLTNINKEKDEQNYREKDSEKDLEKDIEKEIEKDIEKDEEKGDEQMETTSYNSNDDDLYDNMYAPVNDSPKTGQQYSVSSSSSLIEDELEMIRNELQTPVLTSVLTPVMTPESDPEMEIDIRERNDSVSEVESADECELMIASSSETEDNNIDNEINNSNEKSLMQSNNEPINLTLNEAQNDESNDQSLKSVFSTIDPTASPFC